MRILLTFVVIGVAHAYLWRIASLRWPCNPTSNASTMKKVCLPGAAGWVLLIKIVCAMPGDKIHLPEPDKFDNLTELIAVRVHPDAKARFARAVQRRGFRSVAEYLRKVVALEISQAEQATEAA